MKLLVVMILTALVFTADAAFACGVVGATIDLTGRHVYVPGGVFIDAAIVLVLLICIVYRIHSVIDKRVKDAVLNTPKPQVPEQQH